MINKLYEVLGVTEDASLEEIKSAYETLKNKYMDERFLEGEAGNNAAKKLTEVENAYREILSYKEQNGYKLWLCWWKMEFWYNGRRVYQRHGFIP